LSQNVAPSICPTLCRSGPVLDALLQGWRIAAFEFPIPTGDAWHRLSDDVERVIPGNFDRDGK
jgi:hypothetical protein